MNNETRPPLAPLPGSPSTPPGPPSSPSTLYPTPLRDRPQPSTPPKPVVSPKQGRPWWPFVVVPVIAIVTFFAGYQLAVYQEQKGSQLLPHFNTKSNRPCYSLTANPQPIPCSDLRSGGLYKPVIYLYPTHPEDVNVKVTYPAGFQTTVPSYNAATGWQVAAQPNGMLTNLADNKTYPYLFWEGKPAPFGFNMDQGFVVAGSDTRSFLQRQLTSMGLNQNETNGFIAFWLPRMQTNPYNLIHFAGSEYTDYAKLTITPQPDSLLRVFMAFTPLQKPVKISSSQTFPAFHRNGFTAVEWGGTELY